MTRPGGQGTLQCAWHSGHKRVHCLIYQAITTRDGLIFCLLGAEFGRRYDLTILCESGWEELWSDALDIEGDGRQFYLFGDSAYLLCPWMQRPFIHGLETIEWQLFNTAMSSVPVSVEHSNGELNKYWVIQDFAKNVKVRRCPVVLLYKCCAILHNIHA